VFRYGALSRMHPEWHAHPPSWLTPAVSLRLDALYDVQRQSGFSLVELTIRFLVADARPSVILVGAATPAELEESIHAVEQGPLPPSLHARIEELGLDD
jgi:aryl-alcohol dehydrogenase-like predicted oxidoreductase